VDQTFDYLDGLRVIEISAFVSAPLAGAILASLGAEVIRVDPLEGPMDGDRWPLDQEGRSLYWAGLNEGKRSVAIDVSRDEGQELVVDLIVGGDGIVLTNNPAAGYLGPSLEARRPDVIVCQITGHPRGVRAVDYTVNAAVGFPDITGPVDVTVPVNAVFPAWDVAAGLHAALGVIGAERRRQRTGQGARLTISLYETALSLTGRLGIYAELAAIGSTRPRIGNDLYGAFGRDFVTSDRRRVMIVAITTAQFRRLAVATGLEESLARLETRLGRALRSHGDIYQVRDDLAALLAPWFSARPMREVEQILSKHGVLHAPYQSFSEAVADDGVWSAGEYLRDAYRTDGSQVVLGPHAFTDGTDLGPGHIPTSGEDTAAVFQDLYGYSPEKMEELSSRRLVP
jgi:2-methylfumaryl-CoA isomerase